MSSFYPDGSNPELASGVADARAFAERAREWANQIPNPVADGEFSAKKYAQDASSSSGNAVAQAASAAQSAIDAANSAASIQNFSLNDLADVTLVASAPDNVLKFTGSEWTNAEDVTADINKNQVAAAAFTLNGVTGGLIGDNFGIEATVRTGPGSYEVKLNQSFGGSVDNLQVGYNISNVLVSALAAVNPPAVRDINEGWFQINTFNLEPGLQDIGALQCVVLYAGAT